MWTRATQTPHLLLNSSFCTGSQRLFSSPGHPAIPCGFHTELNAVMWAWVSAHDALTETWLEEGKEMGRTVAGWETKGESSWPKIWMSYVLILCQNRALSWAGKTYKYRAWFWCVTQQKAHDCFIQVKTLFLALLTQSLIAPYEATISDGTELSWFDLWIQPLQ